MTSVPDSYAPPHTALSTTPALAEGSHTASWVLAGMLALLPLLGVPSELVLQDTLKSALLATGTLLMAWAWLRARPTTLHWHGLLALPSLLMLYSMGSMVWSHTYLAGVEAVRWAVLGLLLWLGLQGLQPSHWQRVAWGIHVGAVGASAWAAAQFWANLDWFNQAASPASTFANRNFFAEYAVCALPFSVLVLAQLQAPRWRQLVACSLGFNIVALMMTGTRSALVALLLIAPVLVYALWRYRRQLAWGHWSKGSLASVLLLVGLTVLALGGIRSSHPESLGQTALTRSWARAATMAEGAVYSEGSFSYRSMMWKGSARMVMDKPWTGVGAGAWEVFIPLYQGPQADEEPDYYAHNEYLQLMAEYGLPIGGAVLAFLMAYLLLAARNTWRLPTVDCPEAPLRAVALTSLLALMVVSLAGFPWRLAGTGALFMLSLAILATTDARLQLRDALGHGTSAMSTWLRRSLTGLLLAGSALAALITAQAMRAEILIVGGIHALNKAQQSQPTDGATAQTAQAHGVALLKEGLSIHAHYRKVISIAAEQLASLKDWENAAMVLQSIADSRPHIANVWSNLVLARIELGQAEPSVAAWRELKRLQPDTPRTRAMEVLVLSRTGQEAQAIAKLHAYFDQGVVEYDMTLLAYTLGLRLHQWDLAARGLRLQAQAWPGNAADSYFRLGNVYVEAGKGFEDRALAAFRLGWQAVPAEEKARYQRQVPAPYREQL